MSCLHNTGSLRIPAYTWTACLDLSIKIGKQLRRKQQAKRLVNCGLPVLCDVTHMATVIHTEGGNFTDSRLTQENLSALVKQILLLPQVKQMEGKLLCWILLLFN